MKFKKRFVTFMLVISMVILTGGQLAQAQEVKVMLGESTYGIEQGKLEQAANSVIQEKFAALKAKSVRVLATMESVGEDYEKDTLNYEMTVFFLHKDTYTAEVKKAKFSLVNGETKQITVSDIPIIKIVVPALKKPPIPLICKLKKGIFLKPTGKFEKGQFDVKPPETAAIEKSLQEDITSEVADMQKKEFSLSWWYAKGLASSPCTEFPSAVSATQQIYKLFAAKFLPIYAAMRLGNTCTVANIAGFLKYDFKLLAWNHIGHGWTGGIVLWDGSLDAATIKALNPYRGISCAVALLNSCFTFKDPLKAAFLYNSPRTYIAGIIALPVNRSEWVDVCFWKKVLFSGVRMDKALADCSKQYNLVGAFGLAGDGGVF